MGIRFPELVNPGIRIRVHEDESARRCHCPLDSGSPVLWPAVGLLAEDNLAGGDQHVAATRVMTHSSNYCPDVVGNERIQVAKRIPEATDIREPPGHLLGH